VTTRPATASPSATATPSPAPAQATLTVTYLTVSDASSQVEGEVTVANSGYAAISGWRIAVALPEDQFTAVSANASGSVSNHILLMQPATGADTVPARGSLSVFFTAYGMQTAPELCAFNNVTCG